MEIDTETIQAKWDEKKQTFFSQWNLTLDAMTSWEAANIESSFKDAAAVAGIKPGELQLPLRIMMVGAKFGPTVFDIAHKIGKQATIRRIEHSIKLLAK